MIVVWRVVDNCNLSCPFCAYDKRLATPRTAADPEQVLRFLNIFGAWRHATGEDALISWLGGEPLLWKPLTGLTKTAQGLGIRISTTTNGTTLSSRSSRDHLVRCYDEVTFSVDGFGDFHDQIRGWPGAYQKLEAGVRRLDQERRQAGSALRLRANIVLMRPNLACFADLCRSLMTWGVVEITFNQLGGRDRPEFFPKNRLTPADFEMLSNVLPNLRVELAAHGVRLLGGNPYLDRIRDTTLDLPLPISDCRVADNFLFMDEQGRLAPCSFTPEHFNMSIDDIISVSDFERLSQWFNNQQRRRPSIECKNCLSTQQFSKFHSQ